MALSYISYVPQLCRSCDDKNHRASGMIDTEILYLSEVFPLRSYKRWAHVTENSCIPHAILLQCIIDVRYTVTGWITIWCYQPCDKQHSPRINIGSTVNLVKCYLSQEDTMNHNAMTVTMFYLEMITDLWYFTQRKTFSQAEI